MARDHQAHIRQRCLRPSAMDDVCLHDARLGSSRALLPPPPLNNSPLAMCGCNKHYSILPVAVDLHGDHTATCTAHSGATKAQDWMVGVLGPLFRTAGHTALFRMAGLTVRTQHGVTASAGQRRSDVEIRSYLQDQAGSRSLVVDLSITHDRFGSSRHV
jgi:hypothetical protein